MICMKRFFAFLAIISGVFFVQLVQAEEIYDISMFERDDCAHCIDQKEFFDTDLLVRQPDIRVRYIDIYTEEGKALFDQFTERYNLVKGTPITVIGNKIVQGFESSDTTGKVIEELAGQTDDDTYQSVESFIKFGGAIEANVAGLQSVCEEDCVLPEQSHTVKIPLIGKTVDVGTLSLSGLALVLGFVDGFNPCAMWVLVMFLLVLTQVGSRKKMWQFAGIFILAEAVMYYLILNVWLTAWDFIALNHIVTPLIGLLSLGSGIYFAYRFATFKPVCTVTNQDQRKTISDRVKALAAKPMSWGVFGAILLLAFSVNVFEFACSIGIPQTFTKVIELNNISALGTQWYMLLYILMYMIDDVIVFGIALYGIDKIHSSQKYTKWATLLGSVCMIALGLIMLLRPELLVF
jgi:hypothetical protein